MFDASLGFCYLHMVHLVPALAGFGHIIPVRVVDGIILQLLFP